MAVLTLPEEQEQQQQEEEEEEEEETATATPLSVRTVPCGVLTVLKVPLLSRCLLPALIRQQASSS